MPLRGRDNRPVGFNQQQQPAPKRQPLGGDFRSREREITTMMKWPQGRPGLNGDNQPRDQIPSGQKPINNIRRRDVSQDGRDGVTTAMTEM